MKGVLSSMQEMNGVVWLSPDSILSLKYSTSLVGTLPIHKHKLYLVLETCTHEHRKFSFYLGLMDDTCV